MNWKKCILFLIFFCFMSCYSEDSKNQDVNKNRLLVSDDLALVLWHMMKNYDGEYDFQELISTLSKLNEKKINDKPLDKCYSSLLDVLEKKATEQAFLNLQTANSFLQNLESTSAINETIKHKIYYKIIKPGRGEPIDYFTQPPLISFKEKTLDGVVLSEYNFGIRIPLSETISGLQKGLIGMKVGEKREIFIHPDFAYGEFPKPKPQSLIIIEVTLISL